MKTLTSINSLLLFFSVLMLFNIIFQLIGLNDGIISVKKEIVKNELKTIKYDTIPVKITTYHANVQECDSNFSQTASGHIISDEDKQFKYCAVSRDLLDWNLNYGDTIIVFDKMENIRYSLIVNDKMANRFKNMVDILIPDDIKGFMVQGYFLIKRK